ncbi:hypothetical protein CDAR_97851 [Caerostris darwini]|uniref:Uncharacterized protein n=1 Tax=Caerostris darwini TaxID=1538125 RepID=A0AAV4MFW1_9ARAC|nr:hypothetical protein CDAR_97851 [Caerostris darwini]
MRINVLISPQMHLFLKYFVDIAFRTNSSRSDHRESMQGQPTPTQAWNGPFEIRFSMGPCPFGPPYGQAGAMNQKLLLPSQSNK